MNGKGICYSPNGNKYEGNWKNNKTNGQGIIYYSSGRWIEGEWEDNKLIGKIFYCDENGRGEE